MTRGDTGPDVRALQVALNVRVGARLRADGVYGPVTERTVRDAQLRLGRPITSAADLSIPQQKAEP